MNADHSTIFVAAILTALHLSLTPHNLTNLSACTLPLPHSTQCDTVPIGLHGLLQKLTASSCAHCSLPRTIQTNCRHA
jgi:hypothetical protein